MRRVLAIAALVALAGCTDVKGATRALYNAGLKPVSVGGYAWFYCAGGKNADAFATKFTARNDRGDMVTGAVCKGYSRGTTIQYHQWFKSE